MGVGCAYAVEMEGMAIEYECVNTQTRGKATKTQGEKITKLDKQGVLWWPSSSAM